MTRRDKDIELMLELVRRLVDIVQDESLSDDDADRQVSKILVGMYQLIARIDGEPEVTSRKASGVGHLSKKMQIESRPPRTKKGK